MNERLFGGRPGSETEKLRGKKTDFFCEKSIRREREKYLFYLFFVDFNRVEL